MASSSFSANEVIIDVTDVEGPVVLVTVLTPVGVGRLIGALRFEGEILDVEGAHVEGLGPGVLGRGGINAVLRKIVIEANVERVIIQGARRTTGRHKGRVPSPVVFPRRC